MTAVLGALSRLWLALSLLPPTVSVSVGRDCRQLWGLQPRWMLAHSEWTCLCLNAGVEEVQPVMGSVWPTPQSSFLLWGWGEGSFLGSDVHSLPLPWPPFPFSLWSSPCPQRVVRIWSSVRSECHQLMSVFYM